MCLPVRGVDDHEPVKLANDILGKYAPALIRLLRARPRFDGIKVRWREQSNAWVHVQAKVDLAAAVARMSRSASARTRH